MKLNFTTSSCAMALAAAVITTGMWGYPVQAQAQKASSSAVTLRSDVKIERTERDASGNEKITLLTPKDVAVVPGDKVVFTLFVNNTSAQPAVGFKATNPMPSAVRFDSATEDWADVSVDNGINWGKLPNLKIKAKSATDAAEVERAATAEDVTHVRWVFADVIAPGAQRTVSYRGVVK